jgi:hypothetical protein
MTRKWLTLKKGKEIIGYLRVGLKMADVSSAVKEAENEIKKAQATKVEVAKAKAAKKPVASKKK